MLEFRLRRRNRVSVAFMENAGLELRRRWPFYTALCVASFLLGGAVSTQGLFGEVTAAWVQAIGSVAAIAAAIWIDLGARREQRALETERDSSALQALRYTAAEIICGMANFAAPFARDAGNVYLTGLAHSRALDTAFRSIDDMLKRIDPTALRSERLVVFMTAAVTSNQFCLAQIETLRAILPRVQLDPPTRDTSVTNLLTDIREGAGKLDDAAIAFAEAVREQYGLPAGGLGLPVVMGRRATD